MMTTYRPARRRATEGPGPGYTFNMSADPARIEDRILLLTDLMMGAVHADRRFCGAEKRAVRHLLAELLCEDTLPYEVEARILAFEPSTVPLSNLYVTVLNRFGFADRLPYDLPVEGLYACGAGCHPAGSVIGAAGYNAAREALAGLSIPFS